MITHLQNSPLNLLSQHRLNNLPRSLLLLRLWLKIRYGTHNNMRSRQRFSFSNRGDIFQPIPKAFAGTLSNHLVDFGFVPVDEVDLGTAEKMLQCVDGGATGASAADDHPRFAFHAFCHLFTYVLKDRFTDSDAVCVGPAEEPCAVR